MRLIHVHAWITEAMPIRMTLTLVPRVVVMVAHKDVSVVHLYKL